jgi:hypothetical protein
MLIEFRGGVQIRQIEAGRMDTAARYAGGQTDFLPRLVVRKRPFAGCLWGSIK